MDWKPAPAPPSDGAIAVRTGAGREMNSPRDFQACARSSSSPLGVPVEASAGRPPFSALPDAVRASGLPLRDLPPPVLSVLIPFRATLRDRLAGQSQESYG